jgi:hypothetical protein
MVHSIIPATWEAELGRMEFQGQPRQKVSRPYLNKQARCGGGMSLITALQEV